VDLKPEANIFWKGGNEMAYNIVKFIHVLAVVFMAAPLYNLIAVHERRRLGKAPFLIDRYFENIIKGAAIRCYIYNLKKAFR